MLTDAVTVKQIAIGIRADFNIRHSCIVSLRTLVHLTLTQSDIAEFNLEDDNLIRLIIFLVFYSSIQLSGPSTNESETNRQSSCPKRDLIALAHGDASILDVLKATSAPAGWTLPNLPTNCAFEGLVRCKNIHLLF